MGKCYVWYTSDIRYSNAINDVFALYTSFLMTFGRFSAFWYM